MRPVLVLALALALAACAASEGEPRPGRPPGSGAGDRAGSSYDGPPVAVDVMQMESYPVQWAAVAKVVVPTGGWRFTLDDATLAAGTLEMRATLEAPGADEMVTQALQPLTVRKGTGTQPIEHVRVLVRRTRRGTPSTGADWRVAARTPIR